MRGTIGYAAGTKKAQGPCGGATGLLLRGLTLACALVLGTAGWTARATAESLETYSLEIAGKPVVMLMEEDYCHVKGGDGLEDALLVLLGRTLAPANDLVALWMNCQGLAALREGGDEADLRRLFVVAISADRQKVDALGQVDREEFISSVHSHVSSKAFLDSAGNRATQDATQKDIDEMLSGDVLEALSDAERASLRTGLAESRDEMLAGKWGIFPLGRDDNSVFMGFSLPVDKNDRMAAVAAITLVKQLPLTFMALDMDPSREVYRELRDEVRDIADRTVAENEI